MDTATLLNIKPEVTGRTNSPAGNDPAHSVAEKKSSDNFKSAYKNQLNADKQVEQKEDESLPQNGKDLPDKNQTIQSEYTEQAEGKQQKDQPRKQLSEQDENNTAENETQEKTDQLESLDIAELTLSEEELKKLVFGVPDKEGQLKSGLVNEQSVKVIDKNSTDKKITSTITGSINMAVKEDLSNTGMAIRTGAGNSQKNEFTPGQSVADFQQYIESSRKQSLSEQAISSIKNFEKNLKIEQINMQLLSGEKSAEQNTAAATITNSSQHVLNNFNLLSSQTGIVQNSGAYEVKTGVGKTGWSQNFNNQIMMMAGNGVQQAKIKLNPAHLGPVEVHVKLTREIAVVNLSSVHASTRDAIDGAIPRLKEMLNENGFSQIDVNVSHQDKRESQDAALLNKRSSSEERSNNEHGNSTMPGDEQLSELNNGSETDRLLSAKLAQSLNIVDYYA